MNATNPLKSLTNSLNTARKSIKHDLPLQAMKHPEFIRRFLNFWAPLRGSGIVIDRIAPDWSKAHLRIKVNPLTANMHGAAFGGTLFAVTDVMFGTMVMGRLGEEFEAWTRTGTFQFLAPGRNGAYLDVELNDDTLQWIRNTIAEDGYCNVPYTSVVYNRDGSVVGIGQQDMHVRPRKNAWRAPSPKHALQPRGLVLESLATAVVWHCFRDQPEILTVLMSEQRRIPQPEDQMAHVIAAALEKSTKSREDLIALGVPEEYLAKFDATSDSTESSK